MCEGTHTVSCPWSLAGLRDTMRLSEGGAITDEKTELREVMPPTGMSHSMTVTLFSKLLGLFLGWSEPGHPTPLSSSQCRGVLRSADRVVR